VTLKGSSTPPLLGIARVQHVENPAGDIPLPGLYFGYGPEILGRYRVRLRTSKSNWYDS
jgi:hypothetical protein